MPLCSDALGRLAMMASTVGMLEELAANIKALAGDTLENWVGFMGMGSSGARAPMVLSLQGTQAECEGCCTRG